MQTWGRRLIPSNPFSNTGRTLKLLYTLLADGTLSGALVADIQSSEYAGLSFGAPHVSSSKTIIFTTSFIDGYYLNGYSTSTCNAGKGAWSVTGKELQTATDGSGLIVGRFSGTGVRSGSQMIGYTFGPYSGGTLGDHTRPRGRYPYGSTSKTLVVSAIPTPAPVPVTAAPTPPPSPGHAPVSPSLDMSPSSDQQPTPPPDQPTSDYTVQALGLSQWLSQTAANDKSLLMAMAVSWVAAPGVLLLLWPFIFDVALDVKAGLQKLV
ncbi:hypothetical protein N2152v2_009935 [Parachlorella kessleri]